MQGTSVTDRMLARGVQNRVKLIREHLEAMQRDAHGMEYAPWKAEVDALWKRIFQEINDMSPGPQRESLEMVRDLWMTYLTHYAALGGPGRT